MLKSLFSCNKVLSLSLSGMGGGGGGGVSVFSNAIEFERLTFLMEILMYMIVSATIISYRN